MAGFGRCNTFVEADIDLAAVRFFDAMNDWSGFLQYFPDDIPLKLSRIDLAEGNIEGVLPCTRRAFIAKELYPEEFRAAVPDYVLETLLAADRDAGTLVFRVEGELNGMRNYYGRITVSPLGVDRCNVRFSAQFDLVEGGDGQAAIDSIEEMHRKVIARMDRMLS
ncbi:Polyketide cyclase / dehydrase and lipid transport [Sphingobium faniae]|nr:Polyketide cyclase / dehydrase and lipid transport [Sphingobium faniae]